MRALAVGRARGRARVVAVRRARAQPGPPAPDRPGRQLGRRSRTARTARAASASRSTASTTTSTSRSGARGRRGRRDDARVLDALGHGRVVEHAVQLRRRRERRQHRREPVPERRAAPLRRRDRRGVGAHVGRRVVQGAWTHVLVPTANRTLRLYQDGALASKTRTGTRRADSTHEPWLGRSDAATTGPARSRRCTRGRALSASEVAALTRGRGRRVTPPTPLPTPPPSPAPSRAVARAVRAADARAVGRADARADAHDGARGVPHPASPRRPTTVARLRDGSTFASKVLAAQRHRDLLPDEQQPRAGRRRGARLWGACAFGALGARARRARGAALLRNASLDVRVVPRRARRPLQLPRAAAARRARRDRAVRRRAHRPRRPGGGGLDAGAYALRHDARASPPRRSP